MIAFFYINAFLQEILSGYVSGATENGSNPVTCEREIKYEELTDPVFLSLFHLAEKCMENICEETQIKSVNDICQQQEPNVTTPKSSTKMLDIIIIAGVSSVLVLAIAAIAIVCIRKRKSRNQRPPSTEMVFAMKKQQSLRQGGLRPLPNPEEPRYSYLEILENPKINTFQHEMSNSQTNVTADYLEPNQVISPKKSTGLIRRRLPSSNPDEHDYQEIQTYEIMK